LERRLANNVPFFQRLGAFGQVGVIDVLESLRNSKAVPVAHLRDLGAGNPRSVAGSDLVGIEAHAVSNPPALGASVAEKHCDRVVRMPGHRPDRPLDLAAGDVDFDDVASDQATLLCRLWADEDCVVPAEVNERLWRLLQPGIIGAAAVVDHRIAAEHDFHIAAAVARCPTLVACGWRQGGRRNPAFRRYALRRERSIRHEAIVYRLAPSGVEVAALHLALPVLANDVVARSLGRTDEREDQ